MTDHPNSANQDEANAASGSIEESIDDLLARLEGEIASIQSEITALEGKVDSGDPLAATHLADLHRRSNSMIGKYVIGRRLQEADSFSSLMRTLREVLESLVGLASFAVYWRESPDDDNLLLCTVEPEDIETDRFVRVGDGPVGEVAVRKEPWVVRPGERRFTIPPTPIGWFPLRHNEEQRGGIAVYEILSHKKGFEPKDIELLELISTHAAGAIESVCAAARTDLAAANTAEVIVRAGDGRKS